MTRRRPVSGAGSGPAGATLLEVLVALLLGVLLATTAAGILAGTRRAVAHLTVRSERLAAVRVARTVLASERDGVRWAPASRVDTLGVRAFRGTAHPCAGGAALLVRVRGIRAPDAAKDSVLLLGASGRWSRHRLTRTGPGPSTSCSGVSGTTQWWTLDPLPPERPVLARYFERGSYHVTAGALRYRRPPGGRQPLTPEVLAIPPSGFETGRAGVRLRLAFPAGKGWVLPVTPVGGGRMAGG